MLAEPHCHKRQCKHYQGVRYLDESLGEESEVVYCKAFPNGIPDEIACGHNLHLEEYEGDHGIRYQRK